MVQLPLIYHMVTSERELQLEEERRKNHRAEPYVNCLPAPQPCRKERKPVMARMFRQRKACQVSADIAGVLKC
jgi:hypothetical protein